MDQCLDKYILEMNVMLPPLLKNTYITTICYFAININSKNTYQFFFIKNTTYNKRSGNKTLLSTQHALFLLRHLSG